MIILIILVAVIILATSIYYISFIKALYITKTPYVWSFDSHLKMLKKLNLEKWKTIIDLWCGDGKVLRFLEKEFWLVWYGYDLNSFAINYWKILNKIKKSKVKLFKWDFTKQDISNYDYIFMYLMPSSMKELEKWIFENKKQDAIVIVNTFPFPNKKPFKIIDKIYLYK